MTGSLYGDISTWSLLATSHIHGRYPYAHVFLHLTYVKLWYGDFVLCKGHCMNIDNAIELITKNYQVMSDVELAEAITKEGYPITASAVEHIRRNRGLKKATTVTPEERIKELHLSLSVRKDKKKSKEITEALAQENQILKREMDSLLEIQKHVESYVIKPKSIHKGEVTAVLVASDWHIDELVNAETVNGLNEYNPEIARKRAEHFFTTGKRLIDIEAQESRVTHVILALLGDFISGHIHEELMENTDCPPVEAAITAQSILISGIEYLLTNTTQTYTIVCHSGNHARTTKTVHFANEAGHSYEYMVYKTLAMYFKDEKRVRFVIPKSYHSYVEVYGMTLRFHHGHAIKYGGGVGGITIPVNKAVAQWNRSRSADMDIFGHLHQAHDGGNWICNGSMIGHNTYAIAIKAAYERPSQMMIGLHSKLGHYVTRRIYFEEA